MVIFFSSAQLVYFNKFFCLSASKLFLILDHTKPSVQKYPLLMLNQQGMHKNLMWNCRICVWVVFLCFLCSCLPCLTTQEWTDQQHLVKTKTRCISLPSILNATIGVTTIQTLALQPAVWGISCLVLLPSPCNDSACTYHSALFVKPQVTHTKRIDRNLLREKTSFVCYTSSVLRKSRHMRQKKKLRTVAKIKTQDYKNWRLQNLFTIVTPPLNTATTLFNEHRSQRPLGTSYWQNILSAFRVVSVSGDHVVCNRP